MSLIKEVLADEQQAAVMDDSGQAAEYIVAVGLPKGLIHQEDGEEPTGVIRIGGKFVELTRELYSVWMVCLFPWRHAENLVVHLRRTMDPQECQSAVDKLFDLGCLARVRLGSPPNRDAEVLDLVPVPAGFGIGNSSFSPGEFRVGAEPWATFTGSKTQLDIIGQSLWSLMDGRFTFSDIIAAANAWLDIGPEMIESALFYTVVELMKGRCLYIDRGVSL